MSETVEDIVRDIRRRNHGCPLDAEASHSTVEDLLHLADRIEAAYKRENTKPAENVNSDATIYNGAKMRETDDWLSRLVSLINGEISHYMAQDADFFSVDCGYWHIQYDTTKGEPK